MYNVEQISRGVSPQRVAEYKQKTEMPIKPLILKPIITIGFAVALSILLICIKIFG